MSSPPLGQFLQERMTVLHAMDNDLSPLEAAAVEPGRAEDTAVAAAILGLPTGLGDLLTGQLGVELPGDKHAMQRADWAARPLSADMMSYAADDVAFLPELWEKLERELRVSGRLSWYEEERDWIRDQPAAEKRRHWTRVRGVGRLDAVARVRARALWHTREQLARDTDTAPGRILTDRMLVQLATKPVRRPGDLTRRGVRRAAVRAFGGELIAALQATSPSEKPVRQRRMSDDDRTLRDELRARRSALASSLGLDAGFLCPNRVLGTAILAEPASPGELRDLWDCGTGSGNRWDTASARH